MSLTDLVLLIKGENGETENHINMIFSRRGVVIMCNMNENLTNHELHYALSVAYIHAGAELKGIILEPNDVAFLGHKLYFAFHQSYKGIQSIKDMSLEEFNEYMSDHGL